MRGERRDYENGFSEPKRTRYVAGAGHTGTRPATPAIALPGCLSSQPARRTGHGQNVRLSGKNEQSGTYHPDFFGGVWTFYPDPVDLRRYNGGIMGMIPRQQLNCLELSSFERSAGL
jgi:hypothetical protein